MSASVRDVILAHVRGLRKQAAASSSETLPDAYCKNLGRCRRKGFNLYPCDHKCICKNGIWMRGDQV